MRVALVHDWLTGMRGGERVLEALVTLYPTATIQPPAPPPLAGGGGPVPAPRLRPGALDEPLRGDRRAAGTGCLPRHLLVHPDALRVGVRGRVRPAAAARRARARPSRAGPAPPLGRRRRPPHPGAGADPRGVRARGAGHLSAGPHRLLPARWRARAGLPLRLGPDALQAARRRGGRVHASRLAARSDRDRPRGGAPPPAGRAGGPLPRLGGR